MHETFQESTPQSTNKEYIIIVRFKHTKYKRYW